MASASSMLRVLAPFNLQELASGLAMGTKAITGEVLATARAAADRRDPLPAHRRIAILEQVAAGMAKDREALAKTIASECGKPIKDALVEVTRAIDTVRLGASTIGHTAGEQIPMDLSAAGAGRIAFTVREPIGVVLAVSAFNHPLNLIAHQVVPAIATGCPVIVKPSLATPLSCIEFVRRLHEAGLDSEWCQVLLADNAHTEAAVRDPRIDFLSFIGSARVGWHLRSIVAPGVRVGLEHGGAAPVIVDETSDLDTMIPLLAKGGFYHAGQVCVSVQRVFAPERMVGDVAARLAAYANTMRAGDPLSHDTDIGPLIAHREVDRVHEWVSEAVNGGGRLACGGARLDRPSLYPATVVVDPPADCRLSTQEIFGPVIAVYGYKTIGQAVQRANSLPWAFHASVFSRDLGTVLSVARQLDATSVMVNDHTAFRVDWMPFGGRRQSGLGMGGIPYAMHELTEPKQIVINTNNTPPRTQ